MEQTKNEILPAGSQRAKIIWKPYLLLVFLFLPVTGGTQFLIVLTGVIIILYLLLKLLDWLFRWAWALIRKKESNYQHQWREFGICSAIFLLVIAVHGYAIYQAEELALEIGVKVQATCNLNNTCSIPNEILALGQETNPRWVKIPSKTLGKDYPVRLSLSNDAKSFQILVFESIQMGFTVFGGVGEKMGAKYFVN